VSKASAAPVFLGLDSNDAHECTGSPERCKELACAEWHAVASEPLLPAGSAHLQARGPGFQARGPGFEEWSGHLCVTGSCTDESFGVQIPPPADRKPADTPSHQICQFQQRRQTFNHNVQGSIPTGSTKKNRCGYAASPLLSAARYSGDGNNVGSKIAPSRTVRIDATIRKHLTNTSRSASLLSKSFAQSHGFGIRAVPLP